LAHLPPSHTRFSRICPDPASEFRRKRQCPRNFGKPPPLCPPSPKPKFDTFRDLARQKYGAPQAARKKARPRRGETLGSKPIRGPGLTGHCPARPHTQAPPTGKSPKAWANGLVQSVPFGRGSQTLRFLRGFGSGAWASPGRPPVMGPGPVGAWYRVPAGGTSKNPQAWILSLGVLPKSGPGTPPQRPCCPDHRGQPPPPPASIAADPPRVFFVAARLPEPAAEPGPV